MTNDEMLMSAATWRAAMRQQSDDQYRASMRLLNETTERMQNRIAALEADNRRLREACQKAVELLCNEQELNAENVLRAALEAKP